MKYTLEERMLLISAGYSVAEVSGERFEEADSLLGATIWEKSTASSRKVAAKAMAKKRKNLTFRRKEAKGAKKRVGKRKDPQRSKAARIGARHRT